MVEKDKTRKIFGIPFFGVYSALSLFIVLVTTAALGSYFLVHPFPVGHDFTTHSSASLKLLYALTDRTIGVANVLTNVPVRYTPLTYFIFIPIHYLSGYSIYSFSMTMIVILILAVFGFIAVGWRLSPYSFKAFLPLAVIFSTSTFWTICVSYNMELTLLMGCAWFFFILFSLSQIKNRFLTGFAVLCAVLLAFSKLVILLHVIPALLILYYGARAQRPWRYFFLSVGIFILTLLWLKLHSYTFLPELKVDYSGMVVVPDRRIEFYPLLLLKNYMGSMLIVGLSVLLLMRLQKKNFNRMDLVFLFSFALPYTFFILLVTKWEWYILESYFALALWFCYSAAQLSESKSARILSMIVLLNYTIIAAFNINSVLNSRSDPSSDDFLFASETRETWSYSSEDMLLVNNLLEYLDREPLATFAVDLSDVEFDGRTIRAMLDLKRPKLTLLSRVVIRDPSWQGVIEFFESLSHSTYLLAAENVWSTYQESLSRWPLTQSEIDLAKGELNYLSRQYRKERGLLRKNGTTLFLYKNINPEKTMLHNEMLEVLPENLSIHHDGMDEKGFELLREGKPDIAKNVFRIGLQNNFQDNAFGLLQSLVSTGHYDEANTLMLMIFLFHDEGIKTLAITYLEKMEKEKPNDLQLRAVYLRYKAVF